MTEVAAALIWKTEETEKRFMICRRPPEKARGGLYEFVGGKLEKGETGEEALIRECREELDISVTVGDVFTSVVHEYPDITIRLTVYNAYIGEEEPKLLEHTDLQWITPEEIDRYEFCPADKDILALIKKQSRKETKTMLTVLLGSTGIVSPKNGFGALPIQRVSDEEAVLLLRKAKENGFTYFDTARDYSDSEHKLGLAFEGMRNEIVIATKTSAKTPEGIRSDLEKSLQNLKTDHIDLYQLHNPPFCPKPGDGTGIYEELLKIKAEGKIRHIGITNHRLNVAREAVESGLYETLQFPFCYLASQEEIELVQSCKEKKVGFIAMKALSGGLLTDSKAAFEWQTLFDNVLPIWGIQREKELDEFISYQQKEKGLSPESEKVIEKDRKELFGSFCRGCGYCMPCPAEIQINDCARMIQMIRRSPSKNWLTAEKQEMMMRIENCLECGHCKSKCPYGLDTPSLLKANLEDYKNILSGKVKV